MNTYQMQSPAFAIHRLGTAPQNAAASPPSAETISRRHRLGADLVLVRRRGLDELHITVQSEPGDTIPTMVSRLNAILREHRGVVARMEVFGATNLRMPFLAVVQREIGEATWPVTWVDSEGFGGGAIAGIHVFALAGTEVEWFRVGVRIAGCIFNDAHARHCLLGEIVPMSAGASRAEQVREVLEQMQAALDVAGMCVNDIARTWFYLDRGIDVQADFHRVRAEFLRHWGTSENCASASTQVIARNPFGVAMSAGAWATVPTSASMNVHAISSPLQGPAGDHDFNCARGTEWNTPGHRRVSISSAASFGLDGVPLHKGDINAQVDHSMDVIEAMLVSRGLDFSDVTRATAYVKLSRHAEALDDWFERQGICFPAVTTHARSCREDLLFEMELDAIMQKPAGVRA